MPLVQERFRSAGYTTIGETGGGSASKQLGFARGFDAFDDRGHRVGREIRRFLEAVRKAPPERPIFAFFHTYAVHSPYRPPPEVLEQFWQGPPALDTFSENLMRFANAAWRLSDQELAYVGAAYDAGIRATDQQLKRLFASLREIVQGKKAPAN